MIDNYMKVKGIKAYAKDIKRLDYTNKDPEIFEEFDVSYIEDEDPWHMLDVYYKRDGSIKPILIDIHGGGFITHDKDVDELFCNAMASRGYVVFSLNYSLIYPECDFYDQVSDIDNAVRWILDHASDYQADTDNIFIAGHSSGGVNSLTECLLCLDEKMREDYKIAPRNYKYKGIILDCGLMQFYKNSIAYNGMRNMIFPKGYKDDKRYPYLVFENNESLKLLPETILITNRKDELKAMSYYFQKLLEKAGVTNTLLDQGSEGHMGIIFEPFSEGGKLLLDKVSELLKE